MRRPKSWMQWLRRICQGVCLVLFLWIALQVRVVGYPTREWFKLFFDLNPLILIATALATHEIVTALLWSLITLGVTVLLGRVFCGWVCPLGAVHAMASWFRQRLKGRAGMETRSPWHRAKYVLLIALLVMAIFGVHLIGILDPISLLYRSVTAGVLPGAHYAVEDSATAIYHADPHIGPLPLTAITEPVYRFFRDRVFQAPRQAFLSGTLISGLFIAIVALNLVRQRFWCRYLCPLGALLGLFAQRPALRLRQDEGQCNHCGKCNLACPAAAQPDRPGEWLSTECYGCWNCVAACDRNGLSFGFESPLRAPAAGKLDLSRRAALAAGVGGISALLACRVPAEVQDDQPYPATLIRPPGALPEREFLQRCLACGACMRACPTNGLQPVALEAGIEALWTPKLVPKIGYCAYDCHLCGKVCPTGAIQNLKKAAKQEVRIGLAFFDVSRCLPHNFGRECIVCEEHCPLPRKAIYLVEQDVVLRDGSIRTVKQPFVDPDLCIGCGVCEWSCVFQEEPAIRVTSANESRNPKNQPILPGAGGFYGG